MPYRPSHRATVRPLRLARASLVVLVALLVGAGAVTDRVTAAPGADWARLSVARAEGDALSQPVAFKSEAAAGPWRLTVTDIALGDDANRMVTGASDFNPDPADGLAYVAVKLKAVNAGSEPERLDGNDFAVADADGIVRRLPNAIPPNPALAGEIAPGESSEGWVVGAATAGDTDLVLVYDSATITGNWADAALALSRDAALPAATARAVKANRTGRDPGEPAGLNTVVATRGWAVEVTQVVTGSDVLALFPESDKRTTALEGANPGSSATWIAFEVTVTNNATGDQPAYFPATGFALADADGNPEPDITILTPPDPDAAGSYAPGASRQGWVAFDAAGYDGALLRFLPYRTDADPRYIAFDGSAGEASEPAFSGTLATGTTVKTTEDGVRLRETASTDAEIVEELPLGTELTVTGAPETGDGLTWYPVKDAASGKTGYVAQQFIAPVS